MTNWAQIKKAAIGDVPFTPITKSTPLIEFFQLHSQRNPTHGTLTYGQRCIKCEQEGIEFLKMGILWFPKAFVPN